MKENTYQKINQWSYIGIIAIGYLFTIGLALGGIAIMLISTMTWLLNDASWMACFGFITGGLILSCASTLFIGKLMKDGDAIPQRHPKTLPS